ncbi:FadR/GntR family transcriptional regulator [Pseudarthrobacter raffinosi]|uniref:FadR/GntR family transcriptional regulator n=1 Tax=Pseudarthrobacter raffinosi TaxID=2953651 RepID=UPI00208E7F83|nr:FadR/GntR family transcriptional regulator [Pseudarthrobacter sp. MDT3-9]MCO4253261.1 FadR family transcriptional regulator [Pseudarthrobacter sp. MDT3-9]
MTLDNLPDALSPSLPSSGSLANPKALPSADELVDLLEERIGAGELSPGSKLASERELAIEYGVSRPVVREALRSLQERGIIEIRPSRGAFVRAAKSFDVASKVGSFARQRGATARDLIQVRGMLEELSARLAAERAGDADVARLRILVDAMDDTRDVLDRARCDIAFHSLIARISGNPVIEIMFSSIAPLVFEQMIRSLDDQAVAKEGAPLHRVVLEAIEAGDADGAGNAMFKHVMLAEDLYGEDLEYPLESVARRKVNGILGGSVRLEDIIEDVLRSI